MAKHRSHKLELKANLKRQAVPQLRGFAYQIWRSVHAWVRLSESEALCLEGGEDFDILGPDRVTAVQVKHRTRALTLRSADVIKAINDFWELQNKNSDVQLRFRFLTTSSITIEKGAPFGPALAGINLWTKCHRSQSDEERLEVVRKLAAFLVKLHGIDSGLKEFLAKADPNRILADLILKIEWDAKNEGSHYVEEVIERLLIYHGDRIGVPPDESRRVINRLLKDAFTCASRTNNRLLFRSDFLLAFQDETTTRIPNRGAYAMQTYPFFMDPHMASTLTSEKTFATVSPIEDPPPIYREGILTRRVLVQHCEDVLAAYGLLLLVGSVGMGKSTIAKLLVASRKGVAWINLRGFNSERAEIRLRQSEIESENREFGIYVFDDLDSGIIVGGLEGIVGRIIYSALQKRKSVIVTGHSGLPVSLLIDLGLSAAKPVKVQRFSSVEIAEFQLLKGCPTKLLADKWTKIIELRTSGHPQLVAAFVSNLKETGWPSPKVDDFIEERHVIRDVQLGARRLLSATLCMDARVLIYRLSLLFSPFRRDQAIAIGDLDPSLSSPGELFDQIVDAWVEEVARDRYRLTPLLSGIAQSEYTQAKVQALHGSIASAILNCGNLTQLEASACIFHGLLGKDTNTLGLVLSSFVTSSKSNFCRLATEISWIISFGGETAPYTTDPFVNFLFRLLQLRVAAVNSSPALKELRQSIRTELELIPQSITRKQARLTFLFYSLLPDPTDPAKPSGLSIQETVETALELRNLLSEFPELARGVIESEDSSAGAERVQSTPGRLVASLLATSCKKAEHLSTFISLMEKLPQNDFNPILQAIEDLGGESSLCDTIWMYEAKQEQPDWQSCLTVLRSALEAFESRGFLRLAATAARGIVVVNDEYLGQTDRAIALAEEFIARLGGTLLRFASAKLLARKKDFLGALKVLNVTLPTAIPSTQSDVFSVCFARQEAAIACAEIGEWAGAMEHFLAGSQLAASKNARFLAIGLLGDAGYAAWKAHKREESLQYLGEALRLLENHWKDLDELSRKWLQKIIGHVILWCGSTVRPHGIVLAEPQAGICSATQIGEQIRELPPTPIDYSLCNLIRLEDDLSFSGAVFGETYDRLRRSSFPPVRFMTTFVAIRRAFRNAEFGDLFSLLIALQQYKSDCENYDKGGANIWIPEECQSKEVKPDFDLYETPLTGALLITMEKGRSREQLFCSWLQNSSGDVHDQLEGWVKDATEALGYSWLGARGKMLDGKQPQRTRYLAALNLALSTPASPEDVMYADCILCQWLLTADWCRVHEHSLERLMVRQWEVFLVDQVPLVNPVVSVPLIEGALRSPGHGVAKILSILEACGFAVRVQIPSALFSQLKNAAAKTSGV